MLGSAIHGIMDTVCWIMYFVEIFVEFGDSEPTISFLLISTYISNRTQPVAEMERYL